jgi:hypothetical protein
MLKLELNWQELGRSLSRTIDPNTRTLTPGEFRIGRDPQRCDLLLNDRSVSALNASIVFSQHPEKVRLINHRDTNPPLVDGSVVLGTTELNGSREVYFGQMLVKVRVYDDSAIDPTIVVARVPPVQQTPPSPASHPRAAIGSPPQHQQPQYQQPQHQQPQHQQPSPPAVRPPAPVAATEYGLECSHCHRISQFQHLKLCCPWCGTSLAAAHSIIVPRH